MAGLVDNDLEDFPFDVPVRRKNKPGDLGSDRQENKSQYPQPQNLLSSDASSDHGAELTTTILKLPNEIMALIFSQLDCEDKVRAACVCSKWRTLMDIPCVWRGFCPYVNVDSLTSKHIEKIRIRNIRSVMVEDCSQTVKLKDFLQDLPNLQKLHLHFQFTSDLRYPGSPKEPLLNLTDFSVWSSLLTTATLESFLQPMVNLQRLNLYCIPNPSILSALRHSKHLVSLCIKCTSNEVEIDGSSLCNLYSIPSLKQLALENVTVEDSALGFISRAFPQLHRLQLTLSSIATTVGMKLLAKLTELVCLHIFSESFEDDWMDNLVTELTKLTCLKLYGSISIGNKCLGSISRLPALRSLQVPIHVDRVELLDTLSQGFPVLKYLCLVNVNPSISRGLNAVKCVPNLQKLVLIDFTINDDFWTENPTYFSKLTKLFFFDCRLMSEQSLIHLSQVACLKSLILKKCEIAGTERIGILKGKEGFKTLTSLELAELEIDDRSLEELSNITHNLEKLKLVSCDNLTENGLFAAVSDLPQIKALKANITAEGKDRLKKIRPDLQFYPV